MNRGSGTWKLVVVSLFVLWLTLGPGGAPAHAITVAPTNPGIDVGGTQQFTASGAITPTAISAGGYHACMLLPDQTVQCWGRNNFGQLGNGGADSSVPVAVSGLTTVTSVSASIEHTCALLQNGTVQCWGTSYVGQLGNGTWGVYNPSPVAVSGITSATALTNRGFHSCVLLSDGRVRCWGRNADGQLGDGTTTDSAVPVTVNGITSPAAVIGGGYHTCALFSDGSVWCWGRNHSGQLGDGTLTSSSTPVRVSGITGVVAVSGGGWHTCALRSDGTVWCWGLNDSGQLGDGGTIPRSSTPVQVAGIAGAVAVAASWNHTCALLSDGTVWCWGANDSGQLGNGTVGSPTRPVRVQTITAATAVSVGGAHTCARLPNAALQCWGWNAFGQLGNGTTTNASTPVTVTGTGLTWTSSNTSVATINATGLATGLSPGSATITATDGSGASASTTLTVRAKVTLTIIPEGSGTGSVSSSPPGITCGMDCSEPYTSGTTVTLTATPSSGSTFEGWTGGGCSGTGPCSVTLTANTTVFARFGLPRFTLSVTRESLALGSGTVTSDPSGINCGAACTASYEQNTVVTLTATPDPLSAFVGWSGGGCSGTGTCTVTLRTDTAVTATFLGASLP